jgi:hypothetical protein
LFPGPEVTQGGVGHVMAHLGMLFAATRAPPRAVDLSAPALGFRISSLGVPLCHQAALLALDISGNALPALPRALGQLAALRSLVADGNKLRTMPAALGRLTALTLLSLRDNHLSSLPPAAAALSRLRALHLDHNAFRALPRALRGRCPALRPPQNPRAALPNSALQQGARFPRPWSRYPALYETARAFRKAARACIL